MKAKLIPDEKNYKLILQKKIDSSRLKKLEYNKELRLLHATEKLDKFYIYFNSELIRNCSTLNEQFFNKETIIIEKSANLKAQEFKKNEIAKIEMSESSIISSLFNSEKDKQTFIEDKMKELDYNVKEKEMKIKNLESEIQIQLESIKQLIAHLDKVSKENRIIVENVNILIK